MADRHQHMNIVSSCIAGAGMEHFLEVQVALTLCGFTLRILHFM